MSSNIEILSIPTQWGNGKIRTNNHQNNFINNKIYYILKKIFNKCENILKKNKKVKKSSKILAISRWIEFSRHQIRSLKWKIIRWFLFAEL